MINPEKFAKICHLDYPNFLKKKGGYMFNYKAYELGGKIAYPVTQIRYEGKDKYFAFNSQWYHQSECIVYTGTGVLNSDKKEIFEGDFLLMQSADNTCFKNKIGLVSYNEGKFSWAPVDYCWTTYSLAGKSWKYVGNLACDIRKLFTEEEIKKSRVLHNSIPYKSGIEKGVLLEKTIAKINTKLLLENNSYNYSYDKNEKRLLHQYENYLKIKSLIDNGTISPSIMDTNLDIVKRTKTFVKNEHNS